jgi:hypothetical protein
MGMGGRVEDCMGMAIYCIVFRETVTFSASAESFPFDLEGDCTLRRFSYQGRAGGTNVTAQAGYGDGGDQKRREKRKKKLSLSRRNRTGWVDPEYKRRDGSNENRG